MPPATLWKKVCLRCTLFYRRMLIWLRGLDYPTDVNEPMIIFRSFGPCARGTMVDVGSHFGSSLLPYARAGWQVFAFEPDLMNRQRLEQMCAGLSNVTIDTRAVSDREQSGVSFFTSGVSTGISGLSAFHASHKPGGTVDTIRLADFCAQRQIQAIDFLKIDTEGFDLMVLRGLDWNAVQPRVVLCEFEDTKTKPLGYDFHELAGFLRERGYFIIVSEWHPIVAYGQQHLWRRFVAYPCCLRSRRAWGNLIATRDEAIAARLRAECNLPA